MRMALRPATTRPVQGVADPAGVGPLGLEPPERRRDAPVRAGAGEPEIGEVALQGPLRRRPPRLRGQDRRDLRGGPSGGLLLQRHRQLQHRRRGGRGHPPRDRDQRGEPAGPVGPQPPVQVRPRHPHRRPQRSRMLTRRDRPDHPAPLLGGQPRVQRVLDQPEPEQRDLPGQRPAGRLPIRCSYSRHRLQWADVRPAGRDADPDTTTRPLQRLTRRPPRASWCCPDPPLPQPDPGHPEPAAAPTSQPRPAATASGNHPAAARPPGPARRASPPPPPPPRPPAPAATNSSAEPGRDRRAHRQHPVGHPSDPAQPAPHRRGRPAHHLGHPPVPQPAGRGQQRGPDHVHRIRPPQQHTRRKQHMRRPAPGRRRAPRASRPQPLRQATDHPRPGPPPRSQPTPAPRHRAHQHPSPKIRLDHRAVDAYRQHRVHSNAPRRPSRVRPRQAGGPSPTSRRPHHGVAHQRPSAKPDNPPRSSRHDAVSLALRGGQPATRPRRLDSRPSTV